MCLPGCLLGVLMTDQMGIQERIEWQAVSMGLKLVLMGMGWGTWYDHRTESSTQQCTCLSLSAGRDIAHSPPSRLFVLDNFTWLKADLSV